VKTAEKLNCPQPDDSGFTRVDLLALLAAVALLAVMALPSLGRGAGKTIIAQCAANLQQYDLALQIYGNENQDNLPYNDSGWPWDMVPAVVSFITNTGVKWNELYCPGTSSRFTEQDNLRLFNYDPSSFRVLGYAGTLYGSASFAGPFATNMNITLTAQRAPTYFGATQPFPVKPASRALVADANLNNSGSSSIYAVMLTYNWVNIDGGYVNAYGQEQDHLSPHLNGTVPLGGNIGMLDGHVEWRNFKAMLPRTSSSPYFYW
jgi:prepilin-type processing-associated H-X9-DG protein